jgi:hypothetical protein
LLELNTGRILMSCPVLLSCNCLSWWEAGQDRTPGPPCPVLSSDIYIYIYIYIYLINSQIVFWISKVNIM